MQKNPEKKLVSNFSVPVLTECRLAGRTGEVGLEQRTAAQHCLAVASSSRAEFLPPDTLTATPRRAPGLSCPARPSLQTDSVGDFGQSAGT